MKRLTTAMMLGAVATVLAASSASAQYIYFGGGANIPVGTFKDGVKTGWIASAGVGADVGKKGLWVEAEGWYGVNKWKTTAGSTYNQGGKTSIWSALGVLGYDLMHGKKWTPYIAGGAGALGQKLKDDATSTSVSKTKFAYTGALGVGFQAGSSTHIFVEGRYLAATGTGYAKMLPITAGVSIQVGKKKM